MFYFESKSDFILHQLPIVELFPALRQALSQHRQIILQAPTGAGKSTALPLAMLDWSEISGRIIMLEPRRVAARTIANFIAQQRQQKIGQEVGYRVRGDTKVSSQTRLEIVTEGVLVRMIQQDPGLDGISLLIFDEIHERHLTTDLALAFALEAQAALRDDLTILAMSATLSALPLQQLMPRARLLESEGRSFPVDIDYRAPKIQENWLIHMGKEIVRLLNDLPKSLKQSPALGLLAFLPGKGEILKLQQFLNERLDADKYLILPLYGELDNQSQDLAVAATSDGQIKIVLATNIAESSLTIAGINLVVDSGWQRFASFNPKTGVTRLSLKRISQASAKQRAGRAGRLSHGYCLRLWGQEEHQRLSQATEPEINHKDLTPMMLDCANWGVNQANALALLTVPPSANEAQAWQLLKQLELVNDEHQLTALGRQAANLNCHPRLAYMLLQAKAISLVTGQQHLPIIAAMLATIIEARSLPSLGEDISQYFQLTLKGLMRRQVSQWLTTLTAGCSQTISLTQALTKVTPQDIGTLLALAFPDRIAKKRGQDGYLLANGTGVKLKQGTLLAQQKYLVVADFQERQGHSAGMIFLAADFSPQWLTGLLSKLVEEKIQTSLAEESGRFTAKKQLCVGCLVLKSTPVMDIAPEQIKQALLDWLMRNGLSALNWCNKTVQLQTRVSLAQRYQPQQQWPDFSTESLLATLSLWLAPYLDKLTSLAQLGKLDIYQILLNQLTWEQQQMLNQLLPNHWLLPTGTKAAIEYENPPRALLKARLQEVFGMQDSPVLAAGQLKVTMALLSPAHRPLAVTADLASFWMDAYVDVKKEMRGRYPKHQWPDDPANTLPTKFTKKRSQNKA